MEWYQGVTRSEGFRSWGSFTRALESRLGPSLFEDYLSTLAKLKQQGSVEDYQNTSEEPANKIEGLAESYLISLFISGLRDEIRYEVQVAKPLSMSAAIGLARLYEDKLNARRKAYRTDTSKTTPPLPPLPSSPTALSRGLFYATCPESDLSF